ncbi:MAG: DEAD/DEAH box helicase [archaeon]
MPPTKTKRKGRTETPKEAKAIEKKTTPQGSDAPIVRTEDATPPHSPPLEEEKGTRFTTFHLRPDIQHGLAENGFVYATPIQAHSIPIILAGKDMLGQAKTGTGKTGAFGIPILQRLSPSPQGVEALIIVPTRELALQVRDEIENMGKHTHARIAAVFGGASMNAQASALKGGASIVVGTPGRMMDFMRQGVLRFGMLQTVVLDEADKMLDMGFKEDIETILSQLPKGRQTLLFSATMPGTIRQLAQKYLKDPVEVNLSEDTLTVEGITQYYLNVDPKERIRMLAGLVKHFGVTKGMVFCQTKRTVDWLEHKLQRYGITAAKIHGYLHQAKRQHYLQAFEEGQYPLLIATNVAARGIHIEDISHVINFDFPDEYETYIHRIGRTARLGKKGVAITFITNVSDHQRIRELEMLMNAKIHELKAK